MVVCFLCLLELYLSAWTCVQSVSSIFDCLLGSFLVGMFSLRRTTGALRRLGRAVMPCRHRAGWLFVSCLFKSSLAAVLRLSALWDLHGFGLACLYCLCLLQGLWGEAAGMVLLYVDALPKGDMFSSCISMLCCYLPFCVTLQSIHLIPRHAVCVAAPVNKGRETQRADDPIAEWLPLSYILCGSWAGLCGWCHLTNAYERHLSQELGI